MLEGCGATSRIVISVRTWCSRSSRGGPRDWRRAERIAQGEAATVDANERSFAKFIIESAISQSSVALKKEGSPFIKHRLRNSGSSLSAQTLTSTYTLAAVTQAAAALPNDNDLTGSRAAPRRHRRAVAKERQRSKRKRRKSDQLVGVGLVAQRRLLT